LKPSTLFEEAKMENLEILRMLFVEHHRQLSETRQKIQTLTHRTVGILTVAAGWLVLVGTAPSVLSRWALIIGVVAIASTSCVTLRRFNRNYRTIAKVIGKINAAFGMFETDRYLPNERIYPEKWEKFGSESSLAGIEHHLIIIAVMALLCIIMALAK
jgi:hypothetical protein